MDFEVKLTIFSVDGTLRRNKVDATRPPFSQDEWELMPNVVERIAEVKSANPDMLWGIATDQPHIGDLISWNTALSMITSLLVVTFGHPLATLATAICPHQNGCECSKPQPTLLNRVMRYYDVSPKNTLFVGGVGVDFEAAWRAGCSFMFNYEYFGWYP